MITRLILASFIFINVSCTNHSEDDLVEINTIENVRYTVNIKPIIDNQCISCHGSIPTNGAPNSLVTYQQVKNSVETGNLIEKISLPNGDPGLMPLGGSRLSQNIINSFNSWKVNGLLE